MTSMTEYAPHSFCPRGRRDNRTHDPTSSTPLNSPVQPCSPSAHLVVIHQVKGAGAANLLRQVSIRGHPHQGVQMRLCLLLLPPLLLLLLRLQSRHVVWEVHACVRG